MMAAEVGARRRVVLKLAVVVAAAWAVAVGVAGVRGQTVIYVNQNSPANPGDGLSWATAYRDLQAAIDAAAPTASAGGLVEIWVAAGTYKPSRKRDPQDPRSASFAMQTRVTWYGGFAGNESSLWQRNWLTHRSILSGDRNDDDPASGTFMNIGDNVRNVVTAVHIQQPCSIDGFEIRGGNADGTAACTSCSNQGAAIYANNADTGTPPDSATIQLTVRNCTILRNSARIGAVASLGFVNAAFESCRVLGNRVDDYPMIASSYNGTRLEITGCLVAGNTSATSSSLLDANGVIEVRDSTIALNSSPVRTEDLTAVGATIRLYNSILLSSGGSSFWIYRAAAVEARNDIIQGGTTNFGQATPAGTIVVESGVLDVDPRFNDPYGPDLVLGTLDDDLSLRRLNPNPSPGIDAGNNGLVPPTLVADAARRRRIFDSDGNGSAIVDLGCYESASPAYTPVLYVRANAMGGNDGSDWANALSGPLGVANALALAGSSPAGTYQEIWVAAGTYKPSAPLSQGGSRSASFQLQDNLAIYGGFAGAETGLAQRSIATNPTILSGDLNGDDIPGNTTLNRSDNSRHVVNGTGAGASLSAILDGFTITGGNADQVAIRSNAVGGGVFCQPGSPNVVHCIISSNSAAAGGGAFAEGGNPPHFSFCQFIGNAATTGGGAYISLTGAEFRDCLFQDNSASQSGGGGLLVHTNAGVVAVRTDWIRNTSTSEGAGAKVFSSSSLSLFDCRFLGNVGGNSAGVSIRTNSSLTCFGTGLVGNRAFNDAGAVYVENSAATLINSAVVSCQSNGTSYGDAGVFGSNASITLRNCLLWGNMSNFGSVQDNQVQAYAGSAISPAQCSIQGWSGNLGGPGNNGSNPLFLRLPSAGSDSTWGTADDDYGDLRLGAGSPAIDSGDSSAVPVDTYDIDSNGNTTESLPIDLAGFPRFVDDPATPNTGPGSPPHVDRGCYEVQVNCLSCPGPREWRSPIGGNWDYSGNWTPSVPQPPHDALVDLGATFQVNFDPANVPVTGASSRSVQSLTVSDGSVTLDLNQTTLRLTRVLEPSLVVGTSAATGAGLTITDGAVAAVDVRIAESANASSSVFNTLAVSGAGANLNCTGRLSVGLLGNGLFSVTGGAQALSRDAIIGDQAGSSGLASVSGAGSLWTIPLLLIIDHGSLDVSSGGRVATGFGTFLFNNARITGDGTIDGPVVNFGSIAPGNSPGTLTINGDYTQVGSLPGLGDASGRLEIQISGAGAGQFDRLVVNPTGAGPSTVTLGGGMYVTFAPGFQPGVTDTFRVLETGASPIDKQFDVIFFPALSDPGLSGRYLRAGYSGLRGPGGGNGITINVSGVFPNPGVTPLQPQGLTGLPGGAAIGNLNGDALPDLAIALPDAGNPNQNITLLFNSVANPGQFTAVQVPSGGMNPSSVAIADIDGDGKNDLVIANRGSDNIRVFRQQSTPGMFTDPSPLLIQLPAGSAPVAVSALDLDGPQDPAHRVDLAIANDGGGGGGGTPGTGSISIARNRGGANPFADPLSTSPLPPSMHPTSQSPDYPDDTKSPDLAVAVTNASGTTGQIALLVNTGGVGLVNGTSSMRVFTVGANPVQVLSGQLAKDGAGTAAAHFHDLVCVNMNDQTVSVLRNTTGPSTLASRNPTYAPAVSYRIDSGTEGLSSDPRSIALADLDNDNDLDLAVLATVGPSQRAIRVLRNDSQAVVTTDGQRQVAFAPLPNDQMVCEAALRLLAGDVTSDSRSDLVTVNAGSCNRGPGQGSVAVGRNILPPLAQSQGACCVAGPSGGVCTMETVGGCANSGGAYLGDLVLCLPCPCAFSSGACCIGSTCRLVGSAAECTGPNHRGVGCGSVCNAPGNRRTPCCMADYNQSGAVSVQDIFDFLAGYFSGVPGTDINQSGGTSVQDIFDYLAAYFGGCA